MRVVVMVERCGALSTLNVAGGARLVSELSLVRLLVRMAVGAGALYVVRLTAPLVTLGTGKAGVLSVQSKSELGVFDGCALPSA